MKQDTAREDELRARILAEVARRPAPTRAQYRRRSVGLAAGGLLATLAVFFGLGGVSMGARPARLVALMSGTALLMALVLTRFASPRGAKSMLGRSRSALVLVCTIVVPLLAVVLLIAGVMWPGPTEVAPRPGSNTTCAVVTFIEGLVPLLVLVLPRRGTDPIHPVLTGALLGTTAGAWSATMAYLRCTQASLSHCLIAHVLPVIVLGAIGAVMGHLFLRLRRID